MSTRIVYELTATGRMHDQLDVEYEQVLLALGDDMLTVQEIADTFTGGLDWFRTREETPLRLDTKQMHEKLSRACEVEPHIAESLKRGHVRASYAIVAIQVPPEPAR